MTAHDERDIADRLNEYADCIIGTLIQEAAAEIVRLRAIETEAKLAGWLFNDDGSIIRPAENGDFMAAIEQANEIIRDRRLEGEAKIKLRDFGLSRQKT